MQPEDNRFLTLLRRREWWIRFAFFVAIFIAWSGPGAEQLAFAAVAASLGSTISHIMAGEGAARFRLTAFLRFLPYFLSISLRGGVDVARRAFSPSMPLAPEFLDYRLRVEPGGSAAVFFASVISLVPGTLCVSIEGELVGVHVLDRRTKVFDELARLERRVAPIFGESIAGESVPDEGKGGI